MSITIALTGNPNCGKTTLFNALTGSNQHVGNYSGVTVEKREGKFKNGDDSITVIDLPGTYSLNYHSPEERVAQEEILSGKIDLLVAVVDAGALSRSLLFVAQLMQLNLPMVLCLNMWDEAEKAGLQLNLDVMKSLMGMPILPTVASHGKGVDELKALVCDPSQWQTPGSHVRLGDTLTEALGKIKAQLSGEFSKHSDWVATKLILDDAKYVEDIGKSENGSAMIKLAKDERVHIEADAKMDIRQYVTEQYYGFVDGMLKEVIIEKQRADARAMSDKIDKVLVHPILGIPIFLGIVYFLFWLTFTLGAYPMDWIDAGFGALSEWINGALSAHEGIRSLIVDGIIGGVGGVLVFLPNILILFLGLAFLEDCGYMARSAFLMDKLMHRVGLHGRSFIPLITGFGCTVPGIMATRTIAGEKERLTTMFILPLMSCGARLPIWLLLVPVFFPASWQAPAMMGIYLFGVLVALLAAWCLRKTVFKGTEEPFVMELPPYRMPTLRATFTHMVERAWLYLKKAGTIILAVSIVLWAMTAYPKMDATEMQAVQTASEQAVQVEHPEAWAKYQNRLVVPKATEAETQAECESSEDVPPTYDELVARRVAEAELEFSAAGRVGKFIEPVLKPMGFDWKISTALLGAFAAKEVFVAQMGIVYSLGETDESSEDLRSALRQEYSTLTGICLIIFLLISAPCMATVAVMKRESNSWKYALAQFGGLTIGAYILAVLIQQIGSLLGLG
ncbi:MAG: ferrous iron transport protein B [Proteobacteria bacterium]|nr:ferrous iron transport protein B [Pseudomonadota bacterium]